MAIVYIDAYSLPNAILSHCELDSQSVDKRFNKVTVKSSLVGQNVEPPTQLIQLQQMSFEGNYLGNKGMVSLSTY